MKEVSDMKTDVKIYVANNEQLPWTDVELGYRTYPMPTMKESGMRQCGDYYATYRDKVMPILVERKSLQDAYGSFVQEKNRARLYAEIVRFQDDPRFEDFVIVVEATEAQFLSYYPWAAVGWHKARGSLPRFFSSIRKKKGTVVQHLKDRGAKIVFAESRQGAADLFGMIITEHIAEVEEL